MSATGRRGRRIPEPWASPCSSGRRQPWRHPRRTSPPPSDRDRHAPRHGPRRPVRPRAPARGPGERPRRFRLDQLVVGPGVPLSDAQWARIEPLLPDRTPRRGGRWRDHREVIDAIAFNFQTGTQWVHLPERYGNWRGVYNRLRMWAVDGT
ncbi:transposase, partial [Streptomyces shenzhenensis]|uniref:transposase n=1 Tax=Streptomyces shenzhenensis TaxID=943815 RepID=UPI0033D4E10F